MKKFWKKTEGFTLVELVVVIAILGILAGVGTVGYSGYVKKANMAADQQLVAGVKNAIELAYYSDPTKFTGTGAVILTDGAPSYTVKPGMGDTLEAAVQAAYGAGADLSLKHNGWGSGAETTNKVLTLFNGITDPDLKDVVTGVKKPSFANNVDYLFGEVKDVSMEVVSFLDDYDYDSGAELVYAAANSTLSQYKDPNNVLSDAQAFATCWQYGNFTFDVGSLDEESIAGAMAAAAATRARNEAFANYLVSEHPEYAKYYSFIAGYSEDGTTNDLIPGDFTTDVWTESGSSIDNTVPEELKTSWATDRAAIDAICVEYLNDPKSANDALAYYTMMYTVAKVSDENALSDEAYWDTMAGAVSLYGGIAQGKTDLDSLSGTAGTVDDGDVMITVLSDSKGIYFVCSEPALG